jgi:hypothetical protein
LFESGLAYKTLNKELETEETSRTDSPVTRLQKDETEDWDEVAKGVEGTETIADEQVIDSVISREVKSC